MEDVLKYGNRLIVMKEGRIIQDLNQEEKQNEKSLIIINSLNKVGKMSEMVYFFLK